MLQVCSADHVRKDSMKKVARREIKEGLGSPGQDLRSGVLGAHSLLDYSVLQNTHVTVFARAAALVVVAFLESFQLTSRAAGLKRLFDTVVETSSACTETLS